MYTKGKGDLKMSVMIRKTTVGKAVSFVESVHSAMPKTKENEQYNAGFEHALNLIKDQLGMPFDFPDPKYDPSIGKEIREMEV